MNFSMPAPQSQSQWTGTKCKEESHARLLNAGGIGLRNSVESGGSAGGTVAAVTRFAGTPPAVLLSLLAISLWSQLP